MKHHRIIKDINRKCDSKNDYRIDARELKYDYQKYLKFYTQLQSKGYINIKWHYGPISLLDATTGISEQLEDGYLEIERTNACVTYGWDKREAHKEFWRNHIVNFILGFISGLVVGVLTPIIINLFTSCQP